MTRLCPECGEPPHYHSFCTLCATLFWPSKAIWETRQRQTQDARAEEDRRFREAHGAGASCGDIAALIGKTKSWVEMRRYTLGLPPFAVRAPALRSDAWKAEEDAKLADTIAMGLTREEAAQALGRSIHAVNYRRGALGLPPFRRPPRPERQRWPPRRVAKLERLRRDGLSFSECAEVLDTTRNAIATAVKYFREPAHP